MEGVWVSKSDEVDHATEMRLYGHAVVRWLPDGRREHVPRSEWYFDFEAVHGGNPV